MGRERVGGDQIKVVLWEVALGWRGWVDCHVYGVGQRTDGGVMGGGDAEVGE